MDEHGVVNAKDVDFNLLRLSDVKEKNNTRNVYVNYMDPNSCGKFRVRLNGRLQAKFGVNVERKPEYTSVYTALSFTDFGADDKESGEAFRFFKKMDEFMVEEAQRRCKDWFNKHNMSKELIEDRYIPLIHYSRNKVTNEISSYPPYVKIGFNIKYNSENNELDVCGFYVKDGADTKLVTLTVDNCEDIIQNMDFIRPIVELKSVWFTQLGFGVKFRLFMGKLTRPKGITVNYDITGGDSDSEADCDAQSEKPSKKQKLNSPDWPDVEETSAVPELEQI